MVGGDRGTAAWLGLKRTTLISKVKKLRISRPVRQLEIVLSRVGGGVWPPGLIVN
jgi:hypothetical protein